MGYKQGLAIARVTKFVFVFQKLLAEKELLQKNSNLAFLSVYFKTSSIFIHQQQSHNSLKSFVSNIRLHCQLKIIEICIDSTRIHENSTQIFKKFNTHIIQSPSKVKKLKKGNQSLSLSRKQMGFIQLSSPGYLSSKERKTP